MIQGHGGNIYQAALDLGCQPEEIIDMSSNLNPLGPPPGLLSHLKQSVDAVRSLPEVDASRATHAFATRHGLSPAQVMASNGTTQLIYELPRILKSRRVLIVAPTYADYADGCRMQGVAFKYFYTLPETGFALNLNDLEKALSHVDTVFLCNPNNPTGSLTPRDLLLDLARRHPQIRFIVDESYLPFVAQSESKSMMSCDLPNVAVLSSMSKIFSIPGLRIGFLIAAADLINQCQTCQMPWAVNSLAQSAILFLSEHRDETDAFIQKSIQLIDTERNHFQSQLCQQKKLNIFDSLTSFMLIQLEKGLTAQEIYTALVKKRLLIRNCSNFEGLDNIYIRISLKQRSINQQLIGHLSKI